MNPSDPSERVERMKQVLADSYPRVAEGQRKEPLPESVRSALRGPAVRETPSASFLDRLLSFFRGPQLAAIGVTAVVVLVAVFTLGPREQDAKDGPDTMRSTGGGTVSLPSLVVLHGLSAEQSAALQASGYFRPEQLLAVPAGQELAAFLEANRRPNLIVVDGTQGTISAPFATAEGPAAMTFTSGETDLAPPVLDMLAKVPQPEAQAE